MRVQIMFQTYLIVQLLAVNMGKRKLTVTQAHGHPKHVQEQCDVWLTAKGVSEN